MEKYSVGVMLAYQIASLEVQEAKYQYLEKEHLLLGLFSLGKALMFPKRFVLNTESRQAVQSEHELIENALSTFAINTTLLRHQLRAKLSKGHYNRTERVIHRSPACKQVFSRVEKLVAPTKSITCLHLLAALLEEPGEIINIIFQETGVVPSNLRQGILTILSPQQEAPLSALDMFALDMLQTPGQPGRMRTPTQPSTAISKGTQKAPDVSTVNRPVQRPAVKIVGNPTEQLAILNGFTLWGSLKDDVLASALEEDILKDIHFSDYVAQKEDVMMALDGLADLTEGGGEKEYNVRRLCRILDVLKTRKDVIFNFLGFINAPEQKVIVFRALLDLSDPTEREYKYLIQRFLGLTSAINEQDTLREVLSQAPTSLKGTARVMKALHNINSVLSAEVQDILKARKNYLGALLEALDMAEMRRISQRIGKEMTFPLYIGLTLYTVAEKTQGEITVGNFLRKYLTKEVPLSALLGILNRNVLAGTYMRSNLTHTEILDAPMDFVGPELATQEILKALDETITKSQVTLDKNKNIVLKGEAISGKILFDTEGNITIESPVTIRQVGKRRHIFLAPQDGPYTVVKGKVRDTLHHTVIPGPPCNVVYGTEVYLADTVHNKLFKNPILNVISPKGLVYGTPEPTENELKAANQLINRRKAAEPKKAGLIEGERPKPLKYKHLVLLYVAKCALEKFYDDYMKNPQEYIDKLLRESRSSREFQLEVDQSIYQILMLIFRISNHFSHDKSGGWKNFWELFTTTIPEQFCKYIEIMTAIRDETAFMLPVLDIQKELGEVYWSIAQLMLIKGGHYLPPIPRATPPSGKYKEILQNIQQDVQTAH